MNFGFQISQGKKSITLSNLMRFVKGFQLILSARGLSFGFPLVNESLEQNVLYLLTTVHINLVTFAPVDQRVWFNLDNQDNNEVITCMQFQHYSNQLVYLIVPFCLAALITSKPHHALPPSSNKTPVPHEPMDDVGISPNHEQTQEYITLRQLLSEDFVSQRGVELMEVVFVTETWNTLILDRDRNSNFKIEPTNLKCCLKRALAPFIISYWAVTTTLLNVNTTTPATTPLEVKSFGKLCQTTLRQKLNSRLSQYYGSLSLDSMNNAIMSLINMGALSKSKM